MAQGVVRGEGGGGGGGAISAGNVDKQGALMQIHVDRKRERKKNLN